jgi:ATP-dependent Clp protease ATP-binding subunit ClpA
MTANRSSKRAIRSRMAQTGERYTEARRALLASNGSDGGSALSTAFVWPNDPLGWFTDQACNAILLAEDEARMLGRPSVEPEHLLLAIARVGNVQRLLAHQRIDAGAIHAEVVRRGGFGAEVVPGPLPRSAAGEGVLREAVAAAVARGTLGPSTEHLLLGLADEPGVASVLSALGVADVIALVDANYPARRPPVDPAMVELRAQQLATHRRTPPSPGPIPPVFERFTAQARRAVDAGVERARLIDAHYLAPAHLLLGLLGTKEGVVAGVLARHGYQVDPAAGPGTEPRPAGAYRAVPTFDAAARRIVAETVLEIAHRHGHRELATGHLFLAILEDPDEDTARVIDLFARPSQIAAEVIEALPGDEHS